MSTYLRILKFVKPYWKHVIISIICTVFFAVLSGASVYLTIPLLDTLFQKNTTTEQVTQPANVSSTTSILPDWIQQIGKDISNSFNQFVFSGGKTDALVKICLLVLLAFLGKNIFGYFQAYFISYVEYAAMKDLRDTAYVHLHQLPMSYFKQEKVGNLISRFTNDIILIQSSISAAFLNLIREPLTIVVFLLIALSISWQLTVIALIVLPFSMIIITSIGAKLRRQSSAIQAKIADITTILQETISGVKVVKAFSMEAYENKKFIGETRNYLKLILKIVRIRNLSSPITEFLSVLVGVFIIYYGGILVLQQQTLEASEFLGFLFAIFQMMPPIKELSTVNNRIQESSAAADRVFEILDTSPSIKDSPNAVELKDFKKDITFENVNFAYEDSTESVLKDVNIHLIKGEIIALVGPSGGGKSTLVDLIPRFYDPVAGRILIDGINIKQIKLENLRGLMGIVTQETFLFNESIKKNIAYGLGDYPIEKIINAAKVANAHDFINELSEGYDTMIGERGIKLSGGQKQRISIARAVLKNPPILIFDEATSSLDNESEALVQEAVERMMKNRTVFVIAHRLSTIRNADKILVLDKGEIVQRGKHDELIQDQDGLYYKFYQMQFRD
jgi:ATP-binding cassette, subfamily B, bacterial MsbA